jgi:prepilin-type N-terminal cleavage/methylation domain-containing protein
MRRRPLKTNPIATAHDRSGVTLVELLLAIAVFSLLVVGLGHALNSVLSSSEELKRRDELVARVRYAMERMVMFAVETDKIAEARDKKLKITERVLDTYVYDPNAATYTYTAAGDGLLDADNNGDGLANQGTGDADEFVTFEYNDVTRLLTETLPNYQTKKNDDYLPPAVICENVTLFKCAKPQNDIIEIELAADDGRDSISLKTRVRTRRITR